MADHPSVDASLVDTRSAESTYRDVNGTTLHVVTAGHQEDPPVVLLHGFPEFWYCWHRYVDPLVDAGYRVLIPDQRGYNLSEKPPRVRSYRLTELSRDILGLIKSTGHRSAHVIGHDWGGMVAWNVAHRYPASVDRLAILNAPHPAAYWQHLRSNVRQLGKSWYVFFFQLPRLPEWIGRRNDYRMWSNAIRDDLGPEEFTDADERLYRVAWKQDGAPTAMINWYRAWIRHDQGSPRDRISNQTLVIWGKNDRALLPELASKSIEYCNNGSLVRIPTATHWLHHEIPDRVTDLLLRHLEN
ncbi:alpha/beta fold hydrolase [Natrinema ejinorense]|uniref:Alpha/beta hydrolase n=1 Tax=Natrinema ejinorense TaxID=373386 RepID=A0A2A5QRV3_9EURY|nr:alpha/beta hydrolase [Natrinema ejinorense]PCR89578.1 alpha/beta hydrolase [Natrinema ejinorense]